MDATRNTTTQRQAADVVVLDAPCSGLGTLRRHAELRGTRREKSSELAALQAKPLLSRRRRRRCVIHLTVITTHVFVGSPTRRGCGVRSRRWLAHIFGAPRSRRDRADASRARTSARSRPRPAGVHAGTRRVRRQGPSIPRPTPEVRARAAGRLGDPRPFLGRINRRR